MRFFVLDHSFNLRGGTEFIDEDPVNTGDAPTCEACGGYTGPLPWLPPFKVELTVRGKAFADLGFGPISEFLVSERFKCLFEENCLTGLEFLGRIEVVRVKRAKGLTAPRYYAVRVRMGEAAVDEAASGLERQGPVTCQKCRAGGVKERIRRLVLEPGTLDSEDLFRPRGLPGTIMASERFKEFCEKYKITNAVFIPPEQYNFDFYPGESSKSGGVY